MKFDCEQDEIMSLDDLADQMITLEQTGVAHKLIPSFTQILESCPEDFQFGRLSESGWRALSPFESQVLFVDNQATGEIVIRTDLRELDGQKQSVRFTVTNSGSWQSKTIFFEISFIDA